MAIPLEEIGHRIRRLRMAAEMTQEELAERSDLTAGFISQVERGKTSISIDSLMMILDALNVHISDFFRPTPQRIVFRAEDAVELDREGVSSFVALVPGAANRTMEPVRVRLAPGESVSLEPFSGEQFGYVLSGAIQVSYASRQMAAGAGESFYASGQYELSVRNDGDRFAEFLWISSPPYF
ncbi:MAG TPA: helix-turn-helix domain-containing protein [Bacteroidetes bacterium]|nr:helix-turn-helix domain-containing protein [Bacteroidota bacterium]